MRPAISGAAASPPRGTSGRLGRELGDVSLFTLIATLGAPLEVTAANLAIETFMPRDRESADRLRELADSAEQATAVPD